MTDITINIKTGSENSEPKVTAAAENAEVVVPKTETPIAEIPKAETPKEEMKEDTPSEKPSSKENLSDKDDAKEMDMTEEEHAKMVSNK